MVSESFGYREFEGPILEPLELFAAKSGDELVKEQAFVFPDRNEELLTLRPELTPTLARMVAARSKALAKPIRWWSFGPFWRYERPQKGRAREFFQWNVDLLGTSSPQADAENAAIAATFFETIGLDSTKVRLLVNSRPLVEARLELAKIPPERRQEIFRLIDRRERMEADAWEASARGSGLSDKQLVAIMDLLTDKDAWRESDELSEFFEALEALGVSDYFSYDPTVIRGLDYYTGTVFEARATEGGFRAILGGGRYDNLVADVGGDPLPAVGFAMGDVVVGLLLESYGAFPQLTPNPADAMVATFDADTLLESLRLATELRAASLRIEWYPKADRLGKQFKYADRQGIPMVVVLGPDELSANQVSVKDLRSGEQLMVAREEVPSLILEGI